MNYSKYGMRNLDASGLLQLRIVLAEDDKITPANLVQLIPWVDGHYTLVSGFDHNSIVASPACLGEAYKVAHTSKRLFTEEEEDNDKENE